MQASGILNGPCEGGRCTCYTPSPALSSSSSVFLPFLALFMLPLRLVRAFRRHTPSGQARKVLTCTCRGRSLPPWGNHCACLACAVSFQFLGIQARLRIGDSVSFALSASSAKGMCPQLSLIQPRGASLTSCHWALTESLSRHEHGDICGTRVQRVNDFLPYSRLLGRQGHLMIVRARHL